MCSLLENKLWCVLRTSSVKNVLINNAVRTLSSRTARQGRPINHPKPYPYEEKEYRIWNYFLDRTSGRFHENSKLIVVDGPIAAGKSEVAREVAKEFDMLYFPEGNLDMWYTNDYGFNLKKVDSQMPESCKSFDVNDFLLNPNSEKAITLQVLQYYVRFSQYVDALAHIMSTGQGVVLDRCVFSDFVFLEAMFAKGYVSKLERKAYYETREASIWQLLHPHLVIYLDVPPKKVLENIQKRNIRWEANSPVLDEEYIQLMEKYYKQEYLKTMSEHSELLVYDWSEGGELEVVVEDVERIDFNYPDKDDTRCSEWNFYNEAELGLIRQWYCDHKLTIMSHLALPLTYCPQLWVPAVDNKIEYEVLLSTPGNKYQLGYNAALGDKNLLFKTSHPNHETLPRIERQIPLK